MYTYYSNLMLKILVLIIFMFFCHHFHLLSNEISETKKSKIAIELQDFLKKLELKNKPNQYSYSIDSLGKYKNRKAIKCQWLDNKENKYVIVFDFDSLDIAKFQMFNKNETSHSDYLKKITPVEMEKYKVLLNKLIPQAGRKYLGKFSVSSFSIYGGEGHRFSWTTQIFSYPYYSEYGVPAILINAEAQIININIPPLPQEIKIFNKPTKTKEEILNIALKNGKRKYSIQFTEKNMRNIIKDFPVSQISKDKKDGSIVMPFYIWKVWLIPDKTVKQKTSNIYSVTFEIDAETGEIISSNANRDYSKENDAEVKRLEGLSKKQFWKEVQKAIEENKQ